MHVSSADAREVVADDARVGAAPVALELGDDLHRAHLRRAGDRAGREGRAQQVERRDAVAQLAGDLGDEVRDVREPLGLEEALDLHGAGLADAREVVAAEVDEHHVLGAVLLGGEQPLGVARRRARSCPAIGFRLARRALDLHVRLGRRADEREVAELEQEEVRRRVDRAAARGRPRAAWPTVGRSARCESTIWNASPRRMCSLHARDAALVLGAVGEAHASGRRRAGALGRRRRAARARSAAISSGSPRSTSAMPVTWSKRRNMSATTKRLSGRSGPVGRAAAPSARARRCGRSRGSRRPARRAPRPPRTRRGATPQPTNE